MLIEQKIKLRASVKEKVRNLYINICETRNISILVHLKSQGDRDNFVYCLRHNLKSAGATIRTRTRRFVVNSRKRENRSNGEFRFSFSILSALSSYFRCLLQLGTSSWRRWRFLKRPRGRRGWGWFIARYYAVMEFSSWKIARGADRARALSQIEEQNSVSRRYCSRNRDSANKIFIPPDRGQKHVAPLLHISFLFSSFARGKREVRYAASLRRHKFPRNTFRMRWPKGG